MPTGDFAFVFGAVVKDLFYDYGISVLSWSGGGMPPQENIAMPFAVGDGSYYQRTVVRQRVITLTCTTQPTTIAGLHSARKQLVTAINREVLSSGTFTLRYYRAGATSVDIPVRYNGGLELDLNAKNLAAPFVISLLAVDPFWRSNSLITETFAMAGAVANSGYIAARSTDGTWTGMAGANSPAAGATQILYANSKLYVAAGSHLYVRTAGVWADYAANAAVNCLCLASDGTTVYVGGAFTSINSISTNYFASLAGTTVTAVTGAPGEIRSISGFGALAVSRVGSNTVLYSWDFATTWSILSSTASTNKPPINTLTGYASSGMGESSLNAFWISDNTSTDLVQSYFYATHRYGPPTGPTTTTLGSAVLGSIKTMMLYAFVASSLWVGGSFTAVSGVTTSGIAFYNGVMWSSVNLAATTTNAIGYDYERGISYAGGTFTSYAVNFMGATLGATPPAAVTAMYVDSTSGTLYASWNSATNMSVSSDVSKSISNPGDCSSFPVITIKRTGGTSAILTALTNTFTGEALLFNYSMTDGETITFVLTRGAKSISSSSGANLVSLLAPGSPFSTWAVSPGTHTYTVSIAGISSPTITVVLTYYANYFSSDSVAA